MEKQGMDGRMARERDSHTDSAVIQIMPPNVAIILSCVTL